MSRRVAGESAGGMEAVHAAESPALPMVRRRASRARWTALAAARSVMAAALWSRASKATSGRRKRSAPGATGSAGGGWRRLPGGGFS